METVGAAVVGIDTGGTFTDVFVSDGRVLKVPSTPADPVRAISQALRAIGVHSTMAVGHGTTVATNAVLERKGASTGLITTAGFEDVLEIRRQNRPEIYDLAAKWPEPLISSPRRLGVDERLDHQGNVLRPVDVHGATEVLRRLVLDGVESLAVCLLFSYANPEHEHVLGSLVVALPEPRMAVSLSHDIAPQYGEFERTSTVVVNAYVLPIMRRYLQGLQRELQHTGVRQLHVMHSNGGLVAVRTAAERPVQTVLSGPAAGVVGARAVAAASGYDHIITFDMGGTSTDVAVVPGEVLEGAEGQVNRFPLLIPMLTIETVGAGGGSIAAIDAGGGLRVGPESAGAVPGPAAYGVGALPTVTDANLVLGRLSSAGLLGGRMPLNLDRAREALGSLARRLEISVEQAAWAVLRLANSNMERAVRSVTLLRGYDPRHFVLVPFGGAGPLHGVEMADGLGIERVLVPPHPGVMAALGLTVPDLQRDYYRTVLLPLVPATEEQCERVFVELESIARQELHGETLFGPPVLERYADVRYVGQSFDLRVPYSRSSVATFADFAERHKQRFGFVAQGQPVEIVHLRLRAIMPRLDPPHLVPGWPEPPRPSASREVWFGGAVGMTSVQPVISEVLWRPALQPGASLFGPAVLEQYDTVTVVPSGWSIAVDEHFNLLLSRVHQ